jgi:hypothetical protein
LVTLFAQAVTAEMVLRLARNPVAAAAALLGGPQQDQMRQAERWVLVILLVDQVQQVKEPIQQVWLDRHLAAVAVARRRIRQPIAQDLEQVLVKRGLIGTHLPAYVMAWVFADVTFNLYWRRWPCSATCWPGYVGRVLSTRGCSADGLAC